MLKRLTFVIGGANSGKSSYAEGLLTDAPRPRVYIATAQAFDDEMRAKIAAHRAARGLGWETREAPLDPASALPATGPVLLDCVTLWLSNLLLAEEDMAAASQNLLARLSDCDGPVVVVSNEVGLGVVPDNALARRFRTAQGRLNQDLAAAADCVVTVIAGLPLSLKGTLP